MIHNISFKSITLNMWENPRAFRNLHLMEIRSMMTGDEIWNLSEQNPDMFYKVWAQFTS